MPSVNAKEARPISKDQSCFFPHCARKGKHPILQNSNPQVQKIQNNAINYGGGSSKNQNGTRHHIEFDT